MNAFPDHLMITIRKAVGADAAKLHAIERSAAEAFRQVRHLSWIADDPVQSIERHLELIALGNFWVAVDDSKLIGFLAAEVADVELHIWELSVLHEEQGRGIGRRLVETACAWAAEQQLFAVTLTTFRAVRWNEPFYHSMGFRTLDDADLCPRLAEILIREAGSGLPKSERCAMVRKLT